MYVFGDFTNLFAYHASSRLIFNGIADVYRNNFSNFTFQDYNPNITNLDDAFAMMIITPDVLTNETLAEFTARGYIGLPFVPSLVVNFTEFACAINADAQVGVDNLTTPYQLIMEVVTNPDYRLKVTTEACDCLDSRFMEFNLNARCYSDETFIYGRGGVDGVLWMVYLFLLIGVIVFLLGMIQVSLIQLACERQVHKIRLAYYKAVLRQDVGWFDLNPSGELSSRLNELVFDISI